MCFCNFFIHVLSVLEDETGFEPVMIQPFYRVTYLFAITYYSTFAASKVSNLLRFISAVLAIQLLPQITVFVLPLELQNYANLRFRE